MSKDDDQSRKDVPAKTKLCLPTGDSPDVFIEDLICADIVETDDGKKFVILFARPNLRFFVDASELNIESLRKVTPVNETGALKRNVSKSEVLAKEIEGKKGLGDERLKETLSEIVYLEQEKFIVVMFEGSVSYFEYDATAKQALESGGVYIGLNFGGNRDINGFTPG